jgi:hypothetical protein
MSDEPLGLRRRFFEHLPINRDYSKTATNNVFCPL